MTPATKTPPRRWRAVIEQCVRRELTASSPLPADEEDLVESGAVDSMAWVSVVRCIEAATGVEDFGDRMQDQPRSITAMLAVLGESASAAKAREPARSAGRPASGAAIAIVGWGAAVGERRVAAAELEHEFHLKAGKISKGAGIESVARVADGEDEVTLALRAAEAALAAAGAGIADVDCLVVSSETHTGYPSLGARLHARLLADAHCAALDIGGACLGMVNGLAVAQPLLAMGRSRSTLLVTADVHSRVLTADRVKGEFGALFGDGASAFLLRAQPAASTAERAHYGVGEVQLGCDVAAASAIRIALNRANGVDLTFEGGALSRAAVGKLEKLIADLELRYGLRRSDALAFATHQPNPRLVTVLARQLGVPADRFPPVARTCGNLGSSTCGVALVRALTGAAHGKQGPIFVASLGPGLLFGSTVLR